MTFAKKYDMAYIEVSAKMRYNTDFILECLIHMIFKQPISQINTNAVNFCFTMEQYDQFESSNFNFNALENSNRTQSEQRQSQEEKGTSSV